MTAGMAAPRRAGKRAGHAGFGRVLRAEWTKFRTVRGWVIGMIVAALVTVLLGLLASLATHSFCNAPPGQTCPGPGPAMGPGGEPVSDSYYFVRQPLAGNGSITARVTSLAGLITYPPAHPNAIVPGVVPWAKAGVIIEPSTRQGSAYAAVMVTGGHGVRMQYDYTHDLAGLPGAVSAASPRWLRLTRSGETLTGYQSADGTHWAEIGAVTLAGLPVTVQAGLFVASPSYVFVTPGFLGGFAGHLTNATAVFDHIGLQDKAPRGRWAGVRVGGFPDGPALGQGGLAESGGRFRVTGTGDLAPLVGSSRTIEEALTGTFAGLIVVIVLGTMFATSEYRRGLIRTTLSASPRRSRVLAAKAIVIGLAAFVAGLAGAAAAVPLGEHILRSNGVYLYPVSTLTELRVIAGTGALFAVTGILALAVGVVVRRSTGVATAVIAAIVLPFLLAVTNVLPGGAGDWLLRLTPAAAFAIQQPLPEYPQVSAAYTVMRGYYPLAPWAGFAVLCGYAALALILAIFLLRKRDA
jgi:ABC-type transport system involved in multi-copper enzyme maturation permease subunit